MAPSVVAVLDSLNAGWGAQYGPVLAQQGIASVGDAGGLAATDLVECLGPALRDAGALPLQARRIANAIANAASGRGHGGSSGGTAGLTNQLGRLGLANGSGGSSSHAASSSAAVCRHNCGRPVAPGTTQKGNPYDTCCKACGISGGSGRHDGICIPAGVQPPQPPSANQVGGFASSHALALCKCNCGRPVAPGTTQKGNPYDTCCKACGISGGSGKHDVICNSPGLPLPRPGGRCKTGCGRPCRPGLTNKGRPWSSCCGGCAQGGAHERNCGKPLGPWKAWHGTSLSVARQIQAGGFKPSSGGALGAGVYISLDRNKAQGYRKPCSSAPRGALLELEVSFHCPKKIDRQGHPLQKTWQQHGYDSAYAPAGSVGTLQENCVKDPRQIRVLRIHTS